MAANPRHRTRRCVNPRLRPVPKFTGPPAIETQKGNLIKDSQCQSQNAPVPKSSAYDIGDEMRSKSGDEADSHKVHYAKIRIVRPRPRRGRVPRPPRLQICSRTLFLGRRDQFSDRIVLKSEQSCMQVRNHLMRSWRHGSVFKKLDRRDGLGEFRLLRFSPKLVHFVRIDSPSVAIPNVSHARKWYVQPSRSPADGCLHLVRGWTRFCTSSNKGLRFIDRRGG